MLEGLSDCEGLFDGVGLVQEGLVQTALALDALAVAQVNLEGHCFQVLRQLGVQRLHHVLQLHSFLRGIGFLEFRREFNEGFSLPYSIL